MDNCTKDIIKSLQKTEPFQPFARLKTGMSTHDRNQTENVGRLQSLLAARGEAVTAYYSDNSPAALARAEDAIEAHRKADAAWNFLAAMSGSKEAPMRSEEAEEIILKCIRLLRDALAKKIKALNDSERERLTAEGIDAEGREHPGITDLKIYLGRLAESIVQLETRKEGDTGTAPSFQWQAHTQLFDIR